MGTRIQQPVLGIGGDIADGPAAMQVNTFEQDIASEFKTQSESEESV